MDADELRTIPVFAELTDEQRGTIAGTMREVELELGTVLVRQGEYAYHLFVVREGIAAVASGERLLTTLGPGDWFGEIGLLTHGVRTANVVALSPMRLLVMVMWDFDDIMREMPDLARGIEARAQELVNR